MSIYILTTGCSINQAFGEILRKMFSKAGLTDDPKEAKVIILNLCAVKKPTEDRGIALAKKLTQLDKKLIITGCLAESSYKRIMHEVPSANIISTGYLLSSNPEEIISRILQGEKIIITGILPELDYPADRILSNPLIGIVPIALGCTNNCTFCVDKRIWGNVRSAPMDSIVKEVRKLVRYGAKEIRLTAHDTAAYGLDKGYTLVDLLENILKIEGNYRIRIGMASPNTLAKISNELLEIVANDKRIYKFIHIPVQSGSNRILRLMNRPYTIEEFKDIFKKVRRRLGPYSTIATDIISAFPTETEEDHKATIRLLEELKPDVVNLSRYGDRPLCPSSKLRPKIHSKIAKRRTRELFETIRKISYGRNKAFIGKTLEVLFLEHRGQYAGRANNNRLVFVKEKVKLGEFYQVKITNVTWKALYGKLTQ